MHMADERRPPAAPARPAAFGRATDIALIDLEKTPLLRPDPHVIMVGEIRDGEVAAIVRQAAYTGHLVLSSMHTIDAATAVLRLTNFGLESYKVAESLVAVLAQRPVVSLCPHCRRVHDDLG